MSAAFDVKWPKRVAAKKSSQEATDELMAELLKAEDVGERVKDGGVEEYMQNVWADNVVRLAGEVPDPGGLLISAVREKLPAIMQDLLDDWVVFATWPDFRAAIKAIPRNAIVRARVKEDRLVKAETRASAPVPQSPTAPLRHAMARATLASPGMYQMPPPRYLPTPAQYAPNPRAVPAANPFVSQGPIHPSNLFAQRPPQTPGNQRFRPYSERIADMKRNILQVPQHPPTDAGRAAWTVQKSTWEAHNGNRTPTELCPYPLTPGMVGLDSQGECYGCAMMGHITANCPNPAIPALEKKWRQIANSIRNGARQESQAAPVHFVATQHMYDPNVAYAYNPWYTDEQQYTNPYHEEFEGSAYITEDQGKGQGSSN
ncbi:hypothetical protein C8J57DRAFT_1250773 [Mycena rebaudengoi]|nr:hypothetical protein C8J57DRAFT_1250773 [Mycena rebaudengoi]